LSKLSVPAHFVEDRDVLSAIPRSVETGIGVDFVHRLAGQVGAPRLDVSGGHEQSHSLARFPPTLASRSGGSLDLFHPFRDRSAIGVNHHDQGLLDPMLPASVIRQLPGKPRPYESFTGPSALRTDFYPNDT
jgi:hypothetical protein